MRVSERSSFYGLANAIVKAGEVGGIGEGGDGRLTVLVPDLFVEAQFADALEFGALFPAILAEVHILNVRIGAQLLFRAAFHAVGFARGHGFDDSILLGFGLCDCFRK